MELRDKTAIVGIGATEFSKNSGRSELQLAAEAVMGALNDAGLAPKDVDGLCSYTVDNNAETEVARCIGAPALTFFTRIHYGGGGACAPLQQAMLAVATGIAKVVVCYRAMNERSQYRFGQAYAPLNPIAEAVLATYHTVHGLMTAAAMFAVSVRRYMYETGTTSEDFGHIAIAARKHASTNPNAFFYRKPITMSDYLNSRMIADPLRLLDCCQESDGAVAVVVTSAERAKSLRQKPVLIRGGAQGAGYGQLSVTNYYRDNASDYEQTALIARQLYEQAGLAPSDIQAAIIYDHFIPTVMPTLEVFGFCKRGEGKDFVKNGNIEIGGRLPVNTNGGQVGEAYIHGMNGVAEAVRQVRGTAINQVANLENIIVTGGSGVPTSGIILGRA
jgi:acetyl-CoA acetyltransferase